MTLMDIRQLYMCDLNSKYGNFSELFPSITLQTISSNISAINSASQSWHRKIEFCKRTALCVCIAAVVVLLYLYLVYDFYLRGIQIKKGSLLTLPRQTFKSICHLFLDPPLNTPVLRDAHTIQVTNPILFIIGFLEIATTVLLYCSVCTCALYWCITGNLGSVVDLPKLKRCLANHQKPGCSPYDGINSLAVAVDRRTGLCTGQAIVEVPMMNLHATGLSCQAKISYNGRQISVSEIGHRKLLHFKNVEWRLPNGKRQTTKELLKNLEIKSQFGYSMIDGGWYLLQSNISKAEEAIEDCADKGFHKIVIKTEDLEESRDVLRDWCRGYKHYLFVIADLDLLKDHAVCDLCMDKIKKLTESPYCVAIGNLPLCYKGKRISAQEQLHNFTKIIELACRIKKPLTFNLSSKDRTHDDFLEILRRQGKDLPKCCIDVANYSDCYLDVPDLIREFGFYVYVSGPSVFTMNYMASLIKSKAVPIENIIICSNNAHGKTMNKNKVCSYEYFQELFLKSQMKYMHKESIDNIKYQSPVVLHYILELLSALVDVPPLKLVKQLNRNAERFYQFP